MNIKLARLSNSRTTFVPSELNSASLKVVKAKVEFILDSKAKGEADESLKEQYLPKLFQTKAYF